MNIKILPLLFLLLFSSCSNKLSNPNYEIFGEEEFTAESDLIYEQGKFGILSLEGKCFEDLTPDALDSYQDTIAEDDVLTVVLYHPSRRDLMDSIYSVCERLKGFKVVNGMIQLPDFPPTKVAGLTLEEAKEALSEGLKGSVRDVEVFVNFRERPSHKVEIMGRVHRASIEVDGKVRLYEVLAKSALSQDANLYASYVLRGDTPLKVDINRLIRDGDMSQNIVMRAGDKIYIANSLEKTALVMGEVRHPRPIPLVTGSISLREAIAMSGGIPFTGDDRCIHVIRGEVCQPQIFVLSMKTILQENNNRLLLIPGDVVYVAEKPITSWNVFLTQLQPTINMILSGQAIYNLSR